MENQHAEPKGEEFPTYVTDKRLLGLLPMFILVLIIVLRISWTLYKSFVLGVLIARTKRPTNGKEFFHYAFEIQGLICVVMAPIVCYLMYLLTLLLLYYLTKYRIGQKTRSPQQRRMYVGSRARPSLAQQEPSIYVSPSNLPPPPKYECMAPPSYDEVVGVHYPNYQVQPITTPITTALAAQTSTDSTDTRVEPRSNETSTVTRTADETIVNVPRAVATSS